MYCMEILGHNDLHLTLRSYLGAISCNFSSAKDREGAKLQDTTVLICSYVTVLAYSAPGGDL